MFLKTFKAKDIAHVLIAEDVVFIPGDWYFIIQYADIFGM